MTRKYNIICTEKYLLIVDDSQITEGDWHIKINKNKVGNYPLDSVNPNKGRYKKIIAHLPLNGSPILNGVCLLPPLEPKGFDEYQYTEEDLVRAFNIGVNSQFESTELKLNKDESIDRHSKNLLKLIKSLQQPKMPIGFECEIEKADYWYLENNNLIKPKTTAAAGLTQWAGQYTY